MHPNNDTDLLERIERASNGNPLIWGLLVANAVLNTEQVAARLQKGEDAVRGYVKSGHLIPWACGGKSGYAFTELEIRIFLLANGDLAKIRNYRQLLEPPAPAPKQRITTARVGGRA